MDRARLPERRNTAHPSGRQWDRFAKYVVDYYAGLCHICNHGGARQADHLTPETERPGMAWKIGDFRPAHGAPGNPCPICSASSDRPVYCNQLRSNGSVERARRIIAERTGKKTPPEREKPGIRPQPDPGRAW